MELFKVYPLFDIEPIKGDGVYIFDKNGNAYLDLYGGHAVISIGHSHPHFVNALSKQIHRLGYYSNSVQNSLQEELAYKLGALSGYENYQLFLCNSGAEAVENALKLASFHTGREKVISFKKGFHGRTSAAVSITDNAKIKAPINLTNQVSILNLYDLDQLESLLKVEDCCAVVIEGIQGIGGINIPEPAFLQSIQRLCHQYGTLLILDEIQSGYGRTGKFFAHQYADIKPDIITVAKGMGNGFPIGGVLIQPDIQPQMGMLGTTFGGNHLACSAGIAVLDVIKSEKLIELSSESGKWWVDALQEIKGIKGIRGKGLMIGIEFDFPIKPMRQYILQNNYILTGSSSNPNVLRLLPPLNIEKEDLLNFNQALSNYLSKENKMDIVSMP